MKKQYDIAILGATGLVGRELFSLLFERSFPVGRLFLLGSSSVGNFLLDSVGNKYEIFPVEGFSWEEIDFLFCCVDSNIAKQWIPKALDKNVVVIDNSSFFRMDQSVPLVIPEINGNCLSASTKLVSVPNCTTIILLMGIFPVIQKWGISRCIATTYQAVSGGGVEYLQRLLRETQEVLLQGEQIPSKDSRAFNLYPHDSPVFENGYCEEEDKIIHESKKILKDLSFSISPFCVRVPVLRAHSMHVLFTLSKNILLGDLVDLYQNSFPGVLYYEQDDSPYWATPNLVSGKDAVYVGKIRKDLHQENTFGMWIVGDQLRKGAALNSIQIAEKLLSFFRG